MFAYACMREREKKKNLKDSKQCNQQQNMFLCLPQRDYNNILMLQKLTTHMFPMWFLLAMLDA